MATARGSMAQGQVAQGSIARRPRAVRSSPSERLAVVRGPAQLGPRQQHRGRLRLPLSPRSGGVPLALTSQRHADDALPGLQLVAGHVAYGSPVGDHG
jgi:hypothetical protein